MNRKPVILSVLFLMSLLTACGSGSDNDDPEPAITIQEPVTVQWEASRHSAVNGPEGGYTVFYHDATFDQPDDDPDIRQVRVDHADGRTPTSVEIEITSTGNWYFRVQSRWNDTGKSELSELKQITVTE